jgi:hypothetical protein
MATTFADVPFAEGDKMFELMDAFARDHCEYIRLLCL